MSKCVRRAFLQQFEAERVHECRHTGFSFACGVYAASWYNNAAKRSFTGAELRAQGKTGVRELWHDEIRVGDSRATFADVVPR